MDKTRTVIPNTPAGRRALEALANMATHIWEIGQSATAVYAAEMTPQAQTISERIDKPQRRYVRTIRAPGNGIVEIAYDYRERAVFIVNSTGKEDAPCNQLYAASATGY